MSYGKIKAYTCGGYRNPNYRDLLSGVLAKKTLYNWKLHFEDLPKKVRKSVSLPQIPIKYHLVQLTGFCYILYLKGMFLYRRLDKRFGKPITIKEAVIIAIIVWVLWPSHHAIGIQQPKTINLPQIASKWPETSKQPQNEAVYRANTQVKSIISHSNNYTFGNCTWYVASVLPVPDGWHDADYWDDAAKNAGYLVSSTPKVGSIAQTDNYGRGHVAIVIAVYSANSFRVREMNFNGFDRVDERNADLNDFQHFIYL